MNIHLAIRRENLTWPLTKTSVPAVENKMNVFVQILHFIVLGSYPKEFTVVCITNTTDFDSFIFVLVLPCSI